MLDGKTNLDQANADYQERYKNVPGWDAGDVAESDEQAQRLLTISSSTPRGRRRR